MLWATNHKNCIAIVVKCSLHCQFKIYQTIYQTAGCKMRSVVCFWQHEIFQQQHQSWHKILLLSWTKWSMKISNSQFQLWYWNFQMWVVPLCTKCSLKIYDFKNWVQVGFPDGLLMKTKWKEWLVLLILQYHMGGDQL